MRVRLAVLALLACLAGACQGNVFSLKVGDCFNGGAEGTVSNVEIVPCTEPHDMEVFAVLTYAAGGDAFPSDAALTNYADQECVAAFQPYVGRDYASSALGIFYLTPTSESWASGDRIVDCLLFQEGEKLTGSMRGAAR